MPLEPRRQELLAAATREGDTHAAAVSIDMNIKGRRENFFQTAPPKWASDLADAIMGMYQVDTSPENVDLEDDEEEERMSALVNSLTI